MFLGFGGFHVNGVRFFVVLSSKIESIVIEEMNATSAFHFSFLPIKPMNRKRIWRIFLFNLFFTPAIYLVGPCHTLPQSFLHELILLGYQAGSVELKLMSRQCHVTAFTLDMGLIFVFSPSG